MASLSLHPTTTDRQWAYTTMHINAPSETKASPPEGRILEVPQPPPLDISTSMPEPREMLERRNALQPILLLSNEILAMFMLHLCEISPICLFAEGSHGYPVAHERLGWVKITHVCRRLRKIALGYPVLWKQAEISEQSGAWLSELLRRSGSLPIEISFTPEHDYGSVRDVCAILEEPQHLCRIGGLSISRDAHTWVDFFRILFGGPAPHLITLDIELDGPLDTVFVLPEPCFAADAPRLSRLHLNGFHLPWSSLRLPSLTCLILVQRKIKFDQLYNIENICGARAVTASAVGQRLPRSSTETMANCLRGLPLLETLILEHSLPTGTQCPDTGTPPILLHHLRRLRLKQRALEDCSPLLDLLKAPQLRFFDLTCSAVAKPLDETQALYRSLAGFLHSFTQSLSAPVARLRIDVTSHLVNLRAQHEVCEKQEEPDKFQLMRAFAPDFLRISLRQLVNPSSTQELYLHRYASLVPLLDALPLTKLQGLQILDTVRPRAFVHSQETIDYPFWQNIYDRCSNATMVLVGSMAIAALLPLLAGRNVQSWTFPLLPAEPRVPVFPRLEHLTIVPGYDHGAAIFVQAYLTKGHPRLENADLGTVFLEVVKECLSSRLGHALPLKSLQLRFRL